MVAMAPTFYLSLVRCSKFISRKQWIITAADDMFIRVYNYNTLEKIKTFEGHTDYIRSLAIHPTQPYVLSSSDDMLIKLWDWNKNWQCVQIFEGHTHYAMMVAFNPKDPNTFASASLDRTIKVWHCWWRRCSVIRLTTNSLVAHASLSLVGLGSWITNTSLYS
jgi:WD40 repeat protein